MLMLLFFVTVGHPGVLLVSDLLQELRGAFPPDDGGLHGGEPLLRRHGGGRSTSLMLLIAATRCFVLVLCLIQPTHRAKRRCHGRVCVPTGAGLQRRDQGRPRASGLQRAARAAAGHTDPESACESNCGGAPCSASLCVLGNSSHALASSLL